MYDYFDQKLGFNKAPTMHFDSDPNNQSNVLGKTAYYDPSNLEIHIFIDGRHPKDMLRSIAHELIHHQQNLEGRLNVGGYMGEGYYLKNEAMRELEQEAMLQGNALMREYEDTLKLEEKNEMSLKEWKNNELNKNLMRKFGLLKEGMPMKSDTEKDLDNDGDTDDEVPAFLKEEECAKCEGECKCEEMNEEVVDEVKEEGLNLRRQKRDKLVAKAAAKVVAGSSAGAEAKNLMTNRAFKGMKPMEILRLIDAAAEEGLKAQEDEISKDFEQPASDMGAFIKSDEEKGPFAGLNEEDESDKEEQYRYDKDGKIVPVSKAYKMGQKVGKFLKGEKNESLQEALRKIAAAKNITLKSSGKKIK
jgi:hypothetical protein